MISPATTAKPGRAAIREFLSRGHERGFVPALGEIEFCLTKTRVFFTAWLRRSSSFRRLHQVFDVVRDSMQLGVKTGNEIAWSVLEKNDEAKGEKDKEKKPKKTADKTHAPRLAD